MLRRRPVLGAPVTHGAVSNLKRSIGAFQLTMFGVGSTVGTRHLLRAVRESVPEAGPEVIVSFIIARVASASPSSATPNLPPPSGIPGSTYSAAYTARRSGRDGSGGCLLLEYGVSRRRSPSGGDQYVNKLLENFFRTSTPTSTFGRPWDTQPGIDQPAGGGPGLPVRPAVDSGSQQIGEGQHHHGADQARVLVMFAVIAFTAFDSDRFSHSLPGNRRDRKRGGRNHLLYIGLDAVSTAGDEVRIRRRRCPAP